MRNLLAGLFGAIIGAVLIVSLQGLTQPNYPQPYEVLWFLFVGSNALQSTFLEMIDITKMPAYLITWIIIGIIITPFSKKGWNLVRSALWIGVFQGVLALVSILLINPELWTAPTRNLDLLYMFSASLFISLFSLISAFPLSMIIDHIRKQNEPAIPEKIETRCQCGAVFKSNPLICSECGMILREEKD